MLLIFDTETTGLPDFKAQSDAKHQPHLVQLAMLLMDDDLNEISSVSLVVRPDDWTIPDDVAKIHGITTEIASRVGVSEKLAVDLYVDLQYATDRIAVAHNVSFDMRIMRIAMLRHGYTKEWQEERTVNSFCTMEKSKSIVNLPPTEKMIKAGFNKPKPPKLSECIQHFFQEELIGAHDALVDVRACARVYRHLKNISA